MQIKTNKNGVKLLAAFMALAMVFVAGFAIIGDNESSVDAVPGDITYISGKVNADQPFGAGSIVVVNGDLTIVGGAKLTIANGATFTINEGVTLTVGQSSDSRTSAIEIEDKAKVDIKGTIVVNEKGSMTMVTGGAVDDSFKYGVNVYGSIIAKNGGSIDLGGKKIAVLNGGSVAISSIGAKVSTIGTGTINLSSGASFNLLGAIKGADNYLIIKGDDGLTPDNTVVKKSQVIIKGDGDMTGLTAANVSSISIKSSLETSSAYDPSQSYNKVTVKVFNLDVSGTVLNGDVVDIVGNPEVTLKDKASSSGNDVTFKDKVSISSNLVVKDGTLTMDNNGYLLVSGEVAVTKTTGKFNYVESAPASGISGLIEVSGKVTMDRSSYTNVDPAGYLIISGGIVDIKNCGIANIPLLAGVYGAVYELPVGTDTELIVCDLVDVMDAAKENDKITSVYVYNAFSNKYYKISEDIDVPANFALNICGYVEIAEGKTVTIDSSALVSITGQLEVEGELVDNTYSLAYNTVNGVTCDVIIDDEVNAVKTFTSLTNALSNPTEGQVIELCRNYEVKKNLIIPAGVTVITNSGDEAIKITSGATLTIDGVLLLKNDSKIVIGVQSDKPNGSIVLNNMIKNANAGDITCAATGGYTLPGAYFSAKLGDDVTSYDYITTVEIAAQYSDKTDAIAIVGTNSFGDVTFTDSQDAPVLDVTINSDAKVSAGTITLVGASLTANGEFTGKVKTSVTDSDVSIAFQKASGFIISIDAYNDGQTITTTAQFSGISDAYKLVGKATLESGNLSLVSNLIVDSIRIAEGATLTIAGGQTLYVNDVENNHRANETISMENYIEKYSGLTVDGKLVVDGTVTWDYVTVNGTVEVTKNGTFAPTAVLVNGAITVDDNKKIQAYILVVNGSISGKVDVLLAMYAFNGADLSAAKINFVGDESAAKSTAFIVDGKEYATIYVPAASDDYSISNIIQFTIGAAQGLEHQATLTVMDAIGYQINTARFFTDAGLEESVGNFADAPMTTTVVGEYEKIYVDMDPAKVEGLVTSGTGLDLYIDNVKNNGGTAVELSVGEHTVSISTLAGYDGSKAYIEFNGQKVTNGKIVITADMKDFTLIATGATPAVTPTPEPTPVPTPSEKDDGMGLTDILLIVLVILAAILVIVVAIRMMRS